jgi:hypothetical protein
MKKYEKPTLEVVQIRVEEDIAKNGNTTAYRIDSTGEIVTMGIFDLMSVS